MKKALVFHHSDLDGMGVKIVGTMAANRLGYMGQITARTVLVRLVSMHVTLALLRWEAIVPTLMLLSVRSVVNVHRLVHTTQLLR